MYVWLGCNGINASPNKMELLIVDCHKAQKTSKIDKLIVSKYVFGKILKINPRKVRDFRLCCKESKSSRIFSRLLAVAEDGR